MVQRGMVGQWGKRPGDTVLLKQSVLPQRTGHFLLEWVEAGEAFVYFYFKTGNITVLDILPKKMGKWTQKWGWLGGAVIKNITGEESLPSGGIALGGLAAEGRAECTESQQGVHVVWASACPTVEASFSSVFLFYVVSWIRKSDIKLEQERRCSVAVWTEKVRSGCPWQWRFQRAQETGRRWCHHRHTHAYDRVFQGRRQGCKVFPSHVQMQWCQCGGQGWSRVVFTKWRNAESWSCVREQFQGHGQGRKEGWGVGGGETKKQEEKGSGVSGGRWVTVAMEIQE